MIVFVYREFGNLFIRFNILDAYLVGVWNSHYFCVNFDCIYRFRCRFAGFISLFQSCFVCRSYILPFLLKCHYSYRM
ncbi:hypothetical protein NY2A_b195L [Paramecium bursaria Chlorella virus NY2A]|uniref:Uncharacterized protein b195L n=1 Tax=Paramecium bursaria Chlorella virus NY2A TaxID=46021 RepID=A7IW70_PBCVN|nr:hypothetical protein NY2A_b195L [Paramecium bursaria Chlorella virus NY2A]ABT14594.1 hypothetical protein NY2A_b195L [Paramecium bursaria Chlorella virus NY2A]